MNIRSYPKVWNLGHPKADGIFDGPVVVQEKVDGSQISWGVIDGNLEIRSKGAQIHLGSEPDLFKPSVDKILALYHLELLDDGVIYRGEALKEEKHNTLCYDRVPDGNIVLYDVDVGLERRLSPAETVAVANRFDIEPVSILYEGEIDDLARIKELAGQESALGGETMEGVVIKPLFELYGSDGKQVMVKYVRPDFKERHRRDWKSENKNQASVVDQIVMDLRTEARYRKAVQRRRDDGELLNTPQDIGPLMKRIHEDLDGEEQEYIKDRLYGAFRKDILRRVAGGLPDWYKQRLAEEAFNAKKS